MAMSRSAALTPEEIFGALGDYDEVDAPIIDGHNHVILPAEQHVAHLDEAGVSRAVMLVARPHPERANNLSGFKQEMAALNQTVSGAQNAGDSIRPAMAQLHESISLYPDRFVGFGQVPLNAPATDLRAWVQTEIIERGLRGIGEISVPPGRAALLEPVLRAASDYNGRLPVLVHAFAPQTIDDIRTFATLAAAYRSVPLILGQLGGLNWLDAIEIVKGATSTLYLDLATPIVSFAPYLAVREIPRRVLFASNAPYSEPVVARFVVERAIAKANAGAELRARIMGGTLLSILGS
jgi:predicted TIM-barrel fold metal-dependent hydrolase